jgi:hypothetical protein
MANRFLITVSRSGAGCGRPCCGSRSTCTRLPQSSSPARFSIIPVRIRIATPAPSGRASRTLLAARASGLGAVPTTYALRFRDELHEVLSLPNDVAAQAIIPVGFPIGNFGPVTRRPVHEITTFDRWDGPHPAVLDHP